MRRQRRFRRYSCGHRRIPEQALDAYVVTADGQRHFTGSLCARCARGAEAAGLASWATWPIGATVARQPELGAAEIVYEGAAVLLSEDRRQELRSALERAIPYFVEQLLDEYRRAFGADQSALPSATELLGRISLRI
jgi:hypothetical protein